MSWSVAAVASAMLLFSGCAVRIGEQDDAAPGLEEVLNDGQWHLDLTKPPSREQVGMPTGRSVITHERAGRQPFDLRISLPGGEELAFEARSVGFDSFGSPDRETGPPTTLDAKHDAPTLAAGRDHLLNTAREFGLDQEPIRKWYDEAQDPDPIGPPTVRSLWLSTTVGYLLLQVRGNYSPPVDRTDSGRTVVHYSLTWDEPASSPVSGSDGASEDGGHE